MPTTFKALKDELHLEDEKQLGIIRDWCHDHVSSDVQHDGNDAEQYEEYLALAQDYLDHFLPNCPTDYKKNSADLSGLTAIQYAAYRGYDHYLSTLRNLTPDKVNHPSAAGMTPLHLAASGGHPLVVNFLLSHGAIATKTNIKNQPPLFSALLVPPWRDASLISKKEQIFRTLNEAAPGFLSHQDTSGDTVIHLMATHGFKALLTDAITQNPEVVFFSNHDGKYPIHNAILNNQTQIVDLLMRIPHVAELIEDHRPRSTFR